MSGDKLASGGKSATFQQPTKEMAGTDVWKKDEAPELRSLQSELDSLNDRMELPEVKPQVGYRGKPFGDQILVQRVEREHSSSLIIPDSLKSKSDVGYVVAVGAKVEKMQAGQLILFDRFASHGADVDLIDEDGIQRKYLLLREYDALMELEKVSVQPDQS
jgi:co-chaperonin GroES (HSP10)